jgi:hypothetical protein
MKPDPAMKWVVVLCIGGVVGLLLGVLLSSGIGRRPRSEPDWRETALANTLANRRAYTLPLNNPDMIPADRAAHMKDEDVVLGVLFRGTARAYPWWLISNYHVVNDTVDELPLLITLCEVCGGASAFRPVVPDLPGITLSFQITGVRHGTIELGDHQTWSKWHPFLGTALSGPLTGRALERRPLFLLKWREWLELYPDSLVVNGSPELRERFHGSESGHIGEDVIPDLFLRSANLSDNRLGRHALVLGIAFPDTGKAYAVPADELVPFPNLFFTELDGKQVLIVRQAEWAMAAFDISQTDFAKDFEIVSKVPLRFRGADGLMWDAFGLSADKEDDAHRMTPTRGYLTEWYEWVTHSPQTEIVNSVQGLSTE